MKETTRATYARAYTRPYQITGTGKLKLNGNMYGTGRFILRPFNFRSPPVFFKRAPVVRIERGNFFLTPTAALSLALSRSPNCREPSCAINYHARLIKPSGPSTRTDGLPLGQNGNGLKTDKNGNRKEIKRERNGNGTVLPVPLYGR